MATFLAAGIFRLQEGRTPIARALEEGQGFQMVEAFKNPQRKIEIASDEACFADSGICFWLAFLVSDKRNGSAVQTACGH